MRVILNSKQNPLRDGRFRQSLEVIVDLIPSLQGIGVYGQMMSSPEQNRAEENRVGVFASQHRTIGGPATGDGNM